MARWLYAVWYQQARGGFVLWPLEALFRTGVLLRRWLFRIGALKSYAVDARVVVVGNIAVGGAGKSPLTGWLATQLAAQGATVAIVSRGYGGSARGAPLRVSSDTDAALCGDEAKMLAQATGLPMYVARDRVAACVRASLDGAQLIVCDDGLQHYRLRRDVEIAVVDAERRHGNGHCLPAGPLREPVSRLHHVDLVVFNGSQDDAPSFVLQTSHAINVVTGEQQPLAFFADAPVRALAGIAHPQRFFDALRAHGLSVEQIDLADHGSATAAQRHPHDAEQVVLMTDKDVVKYDDLTARHWRVPAQVVMDADAATQLLTVAGGVPIDGGERCND